MSSDLVARCLTCRKRQVRCDASRPTCTRCPKDGLECRGYKDQLRIVQVNPNKTSKPVRKKSKAAPTQSQTGSVSLAKHIFVEDRDIWTILDCARYWNRHVIPATFPAERPFFRPFLMGDAIAFLPIPKVCLHFVILAFRSTQAVKLLVDPFTQPDLCYYRGAGLRALPQYLEDAGSDPQGIALMSIVMLMMSDLLITDGTWLLHLDAARRIVALRGGMEAAIPQMPDSTFILVQLLVVDTLTATACDASHLPPVPLATMITDVPNIDFMLITCASSCPAEILQAIARTNALRRRQLEDADKMDKSTPDCDTLFGDLEAFDCTAWAVRMSQLGLMHPIAESNVAPCSSIKGLACVAECYRSAALVYLLLSYTGPDRPNDQGQVRLACEVLHRELDRLFGTASQECDGPLDTQLYKFATWPLVIAAYALVGWDVGKKEGHLEGLFDRVKLIAEAKGVRGRCDVEQYLRKVQERRARRPHLKWTWDMGFPERQTLVI